MRILGIDPGTEKSGVVLCRDDPHRSPNVFPLYADEEQNDRVLQQLRTGIYFGERVDVVFCETIEPMGLPVGHSTLGTMRWIGRFQEAWEVCRRREAEYSKILSKLHLVSRGDEKTTICGAATYKCPKTGRRKAVTDAQIRAALIERFPATGGGKVPQIGTKKDPGPLYGVKGHAWSALAVVMTGLAVAMR